MENTRHKPVVFVSSTCYDLKQVREDLKSFFEQNYGFQAMLSEFNSFPIDPCKGTFENCLNNVDKTADVFVLIIGNRYGYITDVGKSITNLEYLHAKAKGIPIFVFVDKQIYNNMMVWRSNKNADFTFLVDNSKIFEFVSEIYEQSEQWVYTYESVKDITSTLKEQFCLLFYDGLSLKKIVGDSYNQIINADIPPNAIRMYVEKPYAWEYKFLAYVLKGEFDNLQKHRWDFKFGMFSVNTVHVGRKELLDNLSEKLDEISGIVELLGVLINSVIPEAIGDPGVPSNLDMMVYASKQCAELYRRLIEWGLYFKALHTDEMFAKLLQLMYELPGYVMKQIDEFVNKTYSDIISLPDINDGIERRISAKCVLNIANMDEINRELARLQSVL